MTPLSPLPHPSLAVHDIADADLRRIARHRPDLAWELVARRYSERLHGHASFLLRDREEAYDIVQDVLIKAMREPRFFDDDFRMQAWLYRVTRNLCYNQGRDRRRREVILHTNRRSEQDEHDPLITLFRTERQAEILRTLDSLTEDHREILILRYYDDHSYAEIADILQIALGTVMSRLSRARDRLHHALVGSGMLEAS